MSFDLNSMPQFDQQLQQINQQKQQQDELSGSSDERFVVFSAGNTYRMRLCWPVPPDGVRKGPFIFRNAHGDHGQGRTNREITCPSSDYISGKAGYRQCAACAESSKFYSDWADHHNQTSKDLYDQFKRVQRNVALVYMVSDSKNPSNNNKFMLIRVPKIVADYLRRKIFGWSVKKGEAPLSDDQRVGQQAFMPDNGVDLVISVSTEVTPTGSFNSYSSEFLPKPTSVGITQSDINRAGIELRFDEDFYKNWNPEETTQFVKECILGLKMEYELNGHTNGSSGNTYDPSQNSRVTTQQTTMPQNSSPATHEQSVAEVPQQSAKATPPVQNNLDDVLNSLGIQ